MGFWQGLLALVLVFTCGLLIIVILLQRGRGGGLVGAFGGAGGTSAFGAKTGDVFTWITVVVASVFVLLSVVANFVFDRSPRPPALPAEVSPLTTPVQPGGTAVPGAPVKIEPVSVDTPTGTATPPPVKVDGTQVPAPPAGAPAQGTGEAKPEPPAAGEPKPQPAPDPSTEPKKPEEAPKTGGEDKPSP